MLKRAELVVDSTIGTRHLHRISRSGLQALRNYLDQFWATTLDNFAVLAEAEAANDAVTEAEALLDPNPDTT